MDFTDIRHLALVISLAIIIVVIQYVIDIALSLNRDEKSSTKTLKDEVIDFIVLWNDGDRLENVYHLSLSPYSGRALYHGYSVANDRIYLKLSSVLVDSTFSSSSAPPDTSQYIEITSLSSVTKIVNVDMLDRYNSVNLTVS